jgi:hypothetical protein
MYQCLSGVEIVARLLAAGEPVYFTLRSISECRSAAPRPVAAFAAKQVFLDVDLNYEKAETGY